MTAGFNPQDDPPRFGAAPGPAEFLPIYASVQASLAAATGQDADAHDATIGTALDALLREGEGLRLAQAFAGAPSADIHRHLWRLLVQRERTGAPDPGLLVRLFAMPVVVVAGIDNPDAPDMALPGVLADAPGLSDLLRKHGALAGNQSLALSGALVQADTLDLPRLPELLAWRRRSETGGDPLDLAPAPIVVAAGGEAVHLRFLVGTALAGPAADLFREAGVGRWGMPFAQALSRQLSAPGVAVLALPRPPQPLVAAVWQGRMAQREVGAQLFAGNAIRKLRAGTGEPIAVISVHRIDASPDAGEVRLSLSSPFDPRQAEGFRAPLLPLDRVDDVVQMLTALLADCRVADVRVKPGVHGDRDPATGMPLLFKADEAPPVAMH
jgi:hypothetical protein